MINKLSVILLLLAIGGCASSIWKPISEPTFISEKDAYSVTLPSDWVEHAIGKNSKIITKDGVGLQTIKVNYSQHENAFEAIEKNSNINMLPQEISENLIAEIKANYALDNIDILSDEPAVIDGQPGFRLHLEYKTQRGLRRQYAAYGFVNTNGLYTIIYEAPTLHFFERDLNVFETLVKSFKQI